MVPFGHCGRHTKLRAPIAVLALAVGIADVDLGSRGCGTQCAAEQHRRARHRRSGRARQNAFGVARTVDRNRIDLVRVPLGALRSERRASGRKRLRLHPGRHALELRSGQRRCRIPAARSRHGVERRGRPDGRVEPDCGRGRRPGEHVNPAGVRNGARRIVGHGPARELDRSPADLVLVLVASLQLGRRRVRRDRRARPELPLRGQ